MTNSRRKWLQLLVCTLVPMLAYPFLLRGLIEAFHPKFGVWLQAACSLGLGEDGIYTVSHFVIPAYDVLTGIWSRHMLFFGLWLASGLVGAVLWRGLQARKRRQELAHS